MRVGLLGDVRTDGVVPDLIVRSWRRSISISADGANPCQRFTEIDTDSILCRAADPVLDRWQAHLADTGTTLFLSDRAGAIVARRASDSSARRRLDSVHAAEGFDYSEDSIGTNGLGTSMVEKRALLISGSQHYNDALATLACAAAPVCTPAGSVIGSISLGGPIESANPLMLSLTREIGQQIEERLRSSARPQDLALAMSFTRYTNSQRPTVVMDSESILGQHSRTALHRRHLTPDVVGAAEQPRLGILGHPESAARRHDGGSDRAPRSRRPPGAFRPTLRRSRTRRWPHHRIEHPSSALTHMLWRPRRPPRRCWSVEGPAGSGRAATAEALRGEVLSDEQVRVALADAEQATDWTAMQTSLADGTDVVLRRAENIDETDADHLAALIRGHRSASIAGQRTSALLITVDRDRCCGPVLAILDEIGYAARTAAVGRRHLNAYPVLVKQALDRVDPGGRHTMSPAALQSFVQWGWPGNLTELVETLTALVNQVPSSVIERKHLPRHLQQAPPRRQLTLLETR